MSDEKSSTGMNEERAPFDGAAVDIPTRMLEFAEELGVDARHFVEHGGINALKAELKSAFYDNNAEATKRSSEYIREHGTFAQRYGMLLSK